MPIRLLELFGGIGACSAAVNSATQLYKQAGNSIVVNVLEAIIKSLLTGTENKQITLFDLLGGCKHEEE